MLLPGHLHLYIKARNEYKMVLNLYCGILQILDHIIPIVVYLHWLPMNSVNTSAT